MTVYPVAIAIAWNISGRTRDDTAPLPKKKSKAAAGIKATTKLLQRRYQGIPIERRDIELEDVDKKYPEASRNYWDHYENACRMCTGFRIIFSRSISPVEAERAQAFLSGAAQSWALMACHLTPNFHAAMHLLEHIIYYGPVYNWWAYPYERFIGILSKFKTNGHTGGELESTLMRGWWKTIMCQELVSILSLSLEILLNGLNRWEDSRVFQIEVQKMKRQSQTFCMP